MTNQEAQAILTQSISDKDATSAAIAALNTQKRTTLLAFFSEIWPIFQVINNNVTINSKPALFGDTATTNQAKNALEAQINNSKIIARFVSQLKNNTELKVLFQINDELIPTIRIGVKTPNFESSKEFAGDVDVDNQTQNIASAADYISDIIVKFMD